MTQQQQTASILIGVINQTGGVGKTFATTNLEACRRLAGLQTVLVDCDSFQPDASEIGGRLVRFLPQSERQEVINIDLATASVAAERGGGFDAALAFDQIVNAAADRFTIADFPANGVALFASYLAHGGASALAAGGIRLRLVVPVTPRVAAITGGRETIEALSKAAPSADIVLAPFHVRGDPRKVDPAGFEALIRAHGDRPVMDIREAPAEFWPMCEAAGLTVMDAAALGPKGLAARLGLTFSRSVRAHEALSRWATDTWETLRRHDLAPEMPQSKAQAATSEPPSAVPVDVSARKRSRKASATLSGPVNLRAADEAA